MTTATQVSERNSLRLMCLAGFASMASMRMCDPMLLELGQEFQVSTGEASSVVSAFAVAYGVLQLFYGPLGDRFGKQRVISLAVLVCAILSGITAMASNLTVLVLMRAAMGAAAAGIIPLSMAWVGDHVPYERRQETLAKLMGATVTGMMVGLWFGGFAAETLGWRTAFVAMAGMFAVAAVLLLRQWNRLPSLADLPASSLGAYLANTLKLLSARRVQQVLCVTAIEGALVFGTMAFMPTHLHQHYGLSVVAAGSVMMLYGVGGLLYSQLARRWLALLGEKGLVITGSSLIVSGLLLLAWGNWPPVGMAGCFLSGLGFYMLHNTLQTQATQMAPETRGTAVTLFACLLFFGQSSGVLMAAETVDLGWLSYTFSVAAVGVALLGWAVSRLVGRH